MTFDINENDNKFVIADYNTGDTLPDFTINEGDEIVLKIQSNDIRVKIISFIDNIITGKILDVGNTPSEEIDGFKVGDDISFDVINVFGYFK